MAVTEWKPPANYKSRPVTVIGAGVLGRRIAACWISGGYDVNIRDPSAEQRVAAVEYIKTEGKKYLHDDSITPGTPREFESLKEALQNAWLVIEVVPEKLSLKIDTFAELEALAPADAILASNSSSYKSSQMLDKVSSATKTRVLNTHYYMPPAVMIVELMTDGATAPGIFPFLAERQKEAGTIPFIARKESTGFIFNRLWAAVKREVINILAEGVSSPDEVDQMWQLMMVKGGFGPCRLMDQVGLDTVAFIEEHYIDERKLPTVTVDWLRKEYISKGKLGLKSAKGGFYPPPRKIIALDIGLAAETPSTTSGQILQFSAEGKLEKVLVSGQALPDGLDVDVASGRFFWTCMGAPNKNDGAVYSAKLDGSDVRTVVPSGAVHTPKQLVVEPESKKLYFCDREGLRVWRVNFDGSELEALIQNGDWRVPADTADATKWCVGISVVPQLGKFYWTQKGFSKSGKGRIFCANIATPEGYSATDRPDIQLLAKDLPEPIDLEVDEATLTLYWTDRGELPAGNTLNSVRLGSNGLVAASQKKEILVRNLNEAIGVKLDVKNGHVYLTDLGGSLYRCDLDGGNRTKLFTNPNMALTGITVL